MKEITIFSMFFKCSIFSSILLVYNNVPDPVRNGYSSSHLCQAQRSLKFLNNNEFTFQLYLPSGAKGHKKSRAKVLLTFMIQNVRKLSNFSKIALVIIENGTR